MKNYFREEYKAILIGILVFCILYAANELYGLLLTKTGIIKINLTDESWNWHPLLIFSDIILTLLLVMPGLLSGWFSFNKGFVNGIFVISVCQIASFFIFSVNHENFFIDFFLIFFLFQKLIMPVTVGAISGAAGQFYKIKWSGL